MVQHRASFCGSILGFGLHVKLECFILSILLDAVKVRKGSPVMRVYIRFIRYQVWSFTIQEQGKGSQSSAVQHLQNTNHLSEASLQVVSLWLPPGTEYGDWNLDIASGAPWLNLWEPISDLTKVALSLNAPNVQLKIPQQESHGLSSKHPERKEHQGVVYSNWTL